MRKALATPSTKLGSIGLRNPATIPAMTLTDFTTYDEIRAVLGVSDEEIENVTLALPIYATELEFVLSDISEDVITEYTTIAAIAEGSRTAVQQRYYNVVRLFSSYVIAKSLLTSLPMFGFKSVGDGKADTERFDKWEDVKAGVEAGYTGLLARLKALLQQLDPGFTPVAPVVRNFIVAAGLASDPVTSTT